MEIPTDKELNKKKNDPEPIRLALKSRKFLLLVCMAFLYVCMIIIINKNFLNFLRNGHFKFLIYSYSLNKISLSLHAY